MTAIRAEPLAKDLERVPAVGVVELASRSLNTDIPHRPHVGPTEGEHHDHMGRPGSNPFDGGKSVPDVIVGKRVEIVESPDIGKFGNLPQSASFGPGQPEAAQGRCSGAAVPAGVAGVS